MSMPQAIRHINEIKALQALLNHGPMSRADLARELSLTRATAGNIVASLKQSGMILEDGDLLVGKGTRAGRPSTNIGLNPRHAGFLGAEIGVSRLSLVAIDLAANPIGSIDETFTPDKAKPQQVLDQLAAMVRRMLDRLPNGMQVMGLNLTVPGLTDTAGMLLRAPILGWIDLPILEMIRARLGDAMKLGAENDANTFAVADQFLRGANAPQEAVYLYLDSGVGGAIISEGRLKRGARGFAGEIGHMFAGEGGEQAAGEPVANSLETFIGKGALLRRLAVLGRPAGGIGEVAALIRVGDPITMAAIETWARFLGRGLATLVSILDPEAIVLGGPMAALYSHCSEAVDASIRDHLAHRHPVPAIVVSQDSRSAPALGAALILHRQMFSYDSRVVFREN